MRCGAEHRALRSLDENLLHLLLRLEARVAVDGREVGESVGESQDFRATSLETLRQMVATGAGITLLPQLATQGAYANARGVAVLPFAKPVPTRQIGAIWRKTTARRAVIDAMCDLISKRVE